MRSHLRKPECQVGPDQYEGAPGVHVARTIAAGPEEGSWCHEATDSTSATVEAPRKVALSGSASVSAN
jgi:hypothetical protein